MFLKANIKRTKTDKGSKFPFGPLLIIVIVIALASRNKGGGGGNSGNRVEVVLAYLMLSF
jgi:hypothetical protein